jgi:hypothetical protein
MITVELFILCRRNPHITTLNISWGEALELTLPQKNRLLKLLDEVQSKETKGHNK